MLERPGLRLCGWEWDRSSLSNVRRPAQGSGPHQFRRILDLYSHQFLGLVRKDAAPGWNVWRWLVRPTWRVLETEDESLLLTMHCPWGFIRPWEVHDAEDRQVCTIHGNEVFDAAGHLRALAQPKEHSQTRLVSKERIELAVIGQDTEGLELRFAAVIEGDPFAKMAVLGAALALPEVNYRICTDLQPSRVPRLP